MGMHELAGINLVMVSMEIILSAKLSDGSISGPMEEVSLQAFANNGRARGVD